MSESDSQADVDPLGFYRHLREPAAPGDDRLLALLHGTGGDAESFLAFGRAVAPGAGLIALDGDVMEGGMRRFFRRRAEGVYDMEDLATRTARLDGFLEAAIAATTPQPARISGVGYSNGAALGVNYALSSLEDASLPAIKGLVLISPAIGITKLAALAVWQERLGHLLGLEKLAWNSILPEYDPYQYRSFALNAGKQTHFLTREELRYRPQYRWSDENPHPFTGGFYCMESMDIYFKNLECVLGRQENLDIPPEEAMWEVHSRRPTFSPRSTSGCSTSGRTSRTGPIGTGSFCLSDTRRPSSTPSSI